MKANGCWEQLCLEIKQFPEIVVAIRKLYVGKMRWPHPYEPEFRDIRIKLLLKDLSCLLGKYLYILKYFNTLEILHILIHEYLYFLNRVMIP